MSILKYKKNDIWEKVAGTEFNGKVKKNKNLEDLSDKTEARQNLNMTGDTDSHSHDSMYIPEIEKEASQRDWEDRLLAEKINEARKKATETMSAAEKASINSAITNYQTRLSNLQAARSSADTRIYSDYSQLIEQTKNNSQQAMSGKTITVSGTSLKAQREISSWEYNTRYPDKTTARDYKKTSIEPGIPAGNYSLAAILEKIIQLSHEHAIVETKTDTNCRCDCNDSRCCGGGGN